jgi:hypothetical protein
MDIKKLLLWRTHFDMNYDAFLGFTPAAMPYPGCDCAVLPACNRREIFSSAHAGASQCAMSPPWGQGLRKGGDHHLKRGFLQSKFFCRLPGKSSCGFGSLISLQQETGSMKHGTGPGSFLKNKKRDEKRTGPVQPDATRK